MFGLGDAIGAGAAVEDKLGAAATLVALRQAAVVAQDHQLAILHQLTPGQGKDSLYNRGHYSRTLNLREMKTGRVASGPKFESLRNKIVQNKESRGKQTRRGNPKKIRTNPGLTVYDLQKVGPKSIG